MTSLVPRRLALSALAICNLLLGGCGHLFFFPSKEHFLTPDQLGLAYQDVHLTTQDGERLHGWFLKTPQEPRGTVYFLHGNAENISTHIGNVMWLPAQGYQVFLLDYRGYGLSNGQPDIQAALLDAETGYRWLLAQEEVRNRPLFLLGQSLGGAITLTFSAQMPGLHHQVRGIVVDASFSSFRGIAREKLSAFWLTWPLQYPLSWLIPGGHDPIDYIGDLSPVPLMILHGTQDEVVPVHHGRALFAAAGEPKTFVETETGHNGTFTRQIYRDAVLRFLNEQAEAGLPLKAQSASLPLKQ